MKQKILLAVFILMTNLVRAQAPPPIVIAYGLSGTNVTCAGEASAFPNIQQFTVSHTALIGILVIYAPQFFEVSLVPLGGFSNTAIINPVNGNTVIYVRLAASAAPGFISGQVSLQTPGANIVTMNVSGTVNFTPVIVPVSNKAFCNGENTTAITFSGPFANSFTWTNNNTAIGLATNGSGNIPSFTAINNGTSVVTATITVTPFNTSGGITCDGTPTSFTITVNPTPAVNVTNKVFCNGEATAAIPFSSQSANSFSWVNSNTAIGLAAGGTSNIPSFTATNNGASPVTATITVTPHYTGGNITCNGTPVSFTITVNPTPTVNLVSNQVKCNGTLSNQIIFTGSFAGTQYNWLNDNTGIGLGVSGVGNIAPFSVTNTSSATTFANITYYPSYTNAGKTCTGLAKAMIFTINSPNTALLAADTTTQTLPVTGVTYFSNGCTDELIARLAPNGSSPVNGNTTARVWIEQTQPAQFVKRHYQLTPAANASTATGKITLYFTQAEFNDFNAVNATKLPTTSNDATGKANLLIEKRPGTSSNGTGLPNTYTGTPVTINPPDNDIVWNTTASRWEISFDVTGFSGFWIKTIGFALPLRLISFSGNGQNGNNRLQWQTANEINTKQFVLQKSTDGRSFTGITVIASLGTAANSYSFTDNNAATGKTYYRLKVEDIDGSFTYSNIIWISNNAETAVTIYPNPAKDMVTINTGSNSKLLNTTALLHNASGMLLQTIRIQQPQQLVYINCLPAGMYFIKFEDGTTQKLYKQ